MDEATKASAIVEHASRCDGQLYPNIIANEPDFHLRKIKEALYIRHNVMVNRDKGTEVSDTWTKEKVTSSKLYYGKWAMSNNKNNNRLT
ncbi:hypothetical protein M514_12775 [Trichuris suis]|uniref:Uncharacterized protein n=1 Tax=Trichuris suis TaxID=68888 RepID=A0A085LN13_9BILA|nr:hypothetical protein M513_12775 [Trichuris suis]KFD62909.1 hypothetical protein M514_12775 [Trichuris suis]